jgi:MFS family permease
MKSRRRAVREENMTGVFANRWWIVFACACGLLVGAGSILIFSFGVFLKPVTADLGVTRGQLSTGLGISAWFVALASFTIGWLIDRYGTRRVMIPGILLFALAVANFGLMQPKPLIMIYATFCIAGFISGVQTPIPYAAVITHWFDRERGIALGVATAGVGLGVALMPQLAALLIRHFGWREAYFGLGIAVVVLAWLPVIIFVRDPPWITERRQSAGASTDSLPGIDARAAIRSATFWLLAIAFFLGVMAINGTIVHIVALLTDRGIPLQTATGALSIAGIAIIVGRMICGWCLDRFWGPYVAVCFFVLPMAGIALLGSGFAYPVPLIGAALCGAGIGAEIDLMAFFISRYFGLKAYGKIYGLMFMLFNLGTGLGPALSGRAFDMFHSYKQIFAVYEVALAITCILLIRLGAYAYPARHHQTPAATKAA